MRTPITIEELARYPYAEMVRKAHELQTRIIADQQAQDEFGDLFAENKERSNKAFAEAMAEMFR